MHKRSSGILLHITSLSTPYGVGDLGPSAYQFVDFLAKTKQSYWQILPINPTDGINGHSPYSCFSAFAGNPLLISPDFLIRDGWLSQSDVRHKPKFESGSINYNAALSFKSRLLKSTYNHFCRRELKLNDFEEFCKDHTQWLNDFALFMVAKHHYETRSWGEWPRLMRHREINALKTFEQKFFDQIQYIKFEQYLFFKQWFELKSYCQKHRISIIGDIPIYVNYDSADVWMNPKLFKLDRKLKPKFVSGVPPDYFSKTGQRWGNPIYDWNRMRKSGYTWWLKRMEHNLKLFDVVRIDHFRGFVGFWQIPANEKLAIVGKWVKAPGLHFFKTIIKTFGRLPLIAEDLGYITSDVLKLIKRLRLPGMRVMLFAFDDYSKSNPHRPDQYPKNVVAYTGTHDNNTIHGWLKREASMHAKENVESLLKSKISWTKIHWDLIRVLMNTDAQLTIIPMQDILGLGEDARLNRPSTTQHNWQWRMSQRCLKKALERKLVRMTQRSGRVQENH